MNEMLKIGMKVIATGIPGWGSDHILVGEIRVIEDIYGDAVTGIEPKYLYGVAFEHSIGKDIGHDLGGILPFDASNGYWCNAQQLEVIGAI